MQQKAIYTFNAIYAKTPIPFFTKTQKAILKFTRKHNRPQITKAILNKRTMLISQYLTSNYITEP
jgi:hypothetical protein